MKPELDKLLRDLSLLLGAAGLFLAWLYGWL